MSGRKAESSGRRGKASRILRRRNLWLLYLFLLFSICGESSPAGQLFPAWGIPWVTEAEAVFTLSGAASAVSGALPPVPNADAADDAERMPFFNRGGTYETTTGDLTISPEPDAAMEPESAAEPDAETEPDAAAEEAETEPEAAEAAADTDSSAEAETAPEETEPEPSAAEPKRGKAGTGAADFWLHALGDNEHKRVFLFGESGERYTTGEEAASHMVDVEFPVWEMDREGGRRSSTMRVRVHEALAEDVREIFTEIYEDPEQFPMESIGGFVWRDSNPGSEHCSGTAIDINPDQNYQVRDGKALTGSCWKPGEDPRSITTEGSVLRAFTEHGWSWGGSAWAGYSDQSTGYHDYMHFSYMGR